MCEKVENSLEKQALYSPVTSAVHVKESYCFLTYIKKIKNQSHHLSRQGGEVTDPSLGNYQINYLFVQLRLLSPVFLRTFNNNINIILTASNNLRKEDLICNKMLFEMKRIMYLKMDHLLFYSRQVTNLKLYSWCFPLINDFVKTFFGIIRQFKC